MKQHIDTKLGVAVIIIIAITIGAFVWKWERNLPMEQIENNVVMQAKNKSVKDQSTTKTQVNQEEDLKNYPPMDPKEVVRLTELTKDWKTYKSEDGSYEFKYPTDYSVEIMEPGEFSYLKIISNGKCTYNTDMTNKGPCSIIIRRSEYNSEQINNIKNGYQNQEKNNQIFSTNNKIIFINAGPDEITGDVYIGDKKWAYNMFSFSFPSVLQRPEFKSTFQGIYFTLKEIN